MEHIVYRELSSLETDLGYSAKTLYAVSNSISKHYRTVRIAKGNGEERTLLVPSSALKAIQRRVLDVLLSREPISPWATAYRPCGSTQFNAFLHVGKETVLKLDVRHFFDRLIAPLVREYAFPAETYSEPIRMLLTTLCTFHDALAQGAPTSPAISNIVMRGFDETVSAWCREREIRYTRYCDDMTFSGSFDRNEVTEFVRAELKKMRLYLNERKTVAVRRGQRQIVTGLVVNEKLGVPASYKRKLRQELYYCRKYGVKSHCARIGVRADTEGYLRSLLGRVNYVLSVCPERQWEEEKRWLCQKLRIY